MRIHYIAQSLIASDSANSIHVMKMCQALAREGHDVTLSALRGGEDESQAFRYYGVEECFRLVRHEPDSQPLAASLSRVGRLMPGFGLSSAAAIVFGRAAIAPLVRQERPDIVYSRHKLWLAGLPPESPFVAEAHAPPAGKLQRLFEQRLFRRSGFRRLIVISERLKAIYLSLFPEIAPKLIVAHDAADDPFPANREGSDSFHKGFNVGYVGHLYPGRGIELILAMAEVLPDFTFHVVGGTDADLSRFIAANSLSNVIFHGHRPHRATADIFPMFDVVLAPYQRRVAIAGGVGDTSAFMSPLKIFEYMSWEKPILASNLPVLREIITDGENGVLLPPEDAGAWAAALRRLANEPTERSRLGASAREDFLSRHTWRRRAQAVLDGIDGS